MVRQVLGWTPSPGGCRQVTPRIGPCEVCRTTTDRRIAVDRRPRHAFLCTDECERIFRLRLRAAGEDLTESGETRSP